MLCGMQEPGLNTTKDATKEAPKDAPKDFASSFAGILSALRAAKPEREERAALKNAAWNDDELADDVVALSYEKALRTHARYRPTDAIGPDAEAKPRKASRGAKRESRRRETVPAESRKSASVTIRVSRGEWEQLQARASEAQMSVSAYMRSCTFEVEALRAQVKETLAELKQARRAEPVEPAAAKKPVKRETATGWRARLFPRWAQGRAAEA
jgi:Mobilization protein NikA